MRIFASLLVCSALFLFSSAESRAITIDQFDGDQAISASPPNGSMSSVIPTSGAIGLSRSLKVQAGAAGSPALHISAATSGGSFLHSQDTNISGSSTVTWDGDLNADNLNAAGLGGIDFLQDSATAVRLMVQSFDYPSGNPITIYIYLYDAADLSSNKYSVAQISINQQINSLTTIDVPFLSFNTAGPNGAVDLGNIGAIQLVIDGKLTPGADLSVDWFGTDGECQLIPDENGKVIDLCGVCAGDNSSCLDCHGVPNGGGVIDQCNICDGDGTSCLDCNGEIFGSAVLDRCDVCNGDGNSCLGCTDTDQSPKLAELDGGAKKQEALIKKIVKRMLVLKSNPKITKYADAVRVKAHKLQIRNWIISWWLPIKAITCTNTEICIAQSNDPILSEYRLHAQELRQLAIEVVNKIIKITKGIQHPEQSALKSNEILFNHNMVLADSVPLTQSVCE